MLPCKFSFLHRNLYFFITAPQIITSSIHIQNKVIFNSLLFEFQPNSAFMMVCSVTFSWWEDALGRHRAGLVLLNPLCLSVREVMDWPSVPVVLYLLCVRAESMCRCPVRNPFLRSSVSSSHWGSCLRTTTLSLSRSSSHKQFWTNFPPQSILLCPLYCSRFDLASGWARSGP